MKQLASFFLIILVSITIFTVGCAAQPYPFINNIESIERIEIVVIDDSENYSTITSIPEVDKDAFLDEFGSVHFRRYIGDPPSLYGYVIRFVYIDESYEMVSWFTSEYVSNEKNDIF